MQFKVGTFKSSEIRMLNSTLKADWIQFPVENYLAMFPALKQAVVGLFKIKGASPWAITRAEIQISHSVAGHHIYDGEQYVKIVGHSKHAKEVPGAWDGHCSPAIDPFKAAS